MGAQPSQFDVVTEGSETQQEQRSSSTTDYVLQARNNREEPPPRKPKLKRVFTEEPSASNNLHAPVKLCFISLVTVTIFALIIYLMIFGRITFNMNNEEEEGGGPEAEQARYTNNKLTFCSLWMLFTAFCLIGVGAMNFWSGLSAKSTIPSHYRMGVLVGAMLGFANITMIGMLYFVGQNRSEQEEDEGGESQDRLLESQDNNSGDNNYQDEEEVDEEARVGTAIVSFCILSAVLIVCFTSLAAVVFWKHLSILQKDKDMGPNGTRTISPDENVMTKSMAKATVLGEGWNALSILTILGLMLFLVIAPIPLLQQQEEERRREDENSIVWNYIAILIYMTILSLVLYKAGRDVFGHRKTSSQIAVGTMSGFLFYLAAGFVLLGILFSSFQLRREDRRREEESSSTLGSGGFSVLCFVLSGIYTAFAVTVARHHKAIIRANTKDIYSVEQWREPFMSGEMA